MTTGYTAGSGVLHRAAPAVKIVGLTLFCTVVFCLSGWQAVTTALLLTLACWRLAGFPLQQAWQALKPARWLLAAIFILQLWVSDVAQAAFVVLRFACLMLAAALVTRTTRTSEFVEGVKRLLRHAPRWVPADNIALAIALTLRFIPQVNAVYEEVRAAQRARGLDKHPVALLNPLLVRTLKAGDQITDAIRARSPER